MKVDGGDWKDKFKEKSETEKLFDSLLFERQAVSLSVERLRIVKELERLLREDQAKFAEYLHGVIAIYENECGPVLNAGESDPVPEEIKDFYIDKNTTLAQYLHLKRVFILEFLQGINALRNKEKADEITAALKKAHSEDNSQIFNAKKKIETNFPLLELLTHTTISKSFDSQKNEALEKSLEKMRNDFRNDGFNV